MRANQLRRRRAAIRPVWAALWVAAFVALTGSPVSAQFNSGSSGVNGSFPPIPSGMSAIPYNTSYLIWNMSSGLVRYCSAYDTTRRPDTCTTELATGQIPGIPEGGLTTGTFHFTNVNLSNLSGNSISLYLAGNVNNSPLTILSQNTITSDIGVQFFADGMPGAGSTAGLLPSTTFPGGRPGPGGFAGGATGYPGATATNGSFGFGPSGGTGGLANTVNPCSDGFGNSALAPPASTTLAPFVGGSGGGGGAANLACAAGRQNGGAGGGGGGAVLMAANTRIRFSYMYFYMYGGSGGSSQCGCYEGGGGAGGTLRLVAPVLETPYSVAYVSGGGAPRGGVGGGGIVRIEGEASQFNLQIWGQSSATIVASPGPVVPINSPTLRLTSVGDLQVPPAPTGRLNIPDLMFQTPPAGPVNVVLAGSNIPTGTTAKVRVTPEIGSATEVNSSALTGSFNSSTASATVVIPPGFGAITASVTFTCTEALCGSLSAENRIGAVVEVVASASGSQAFIVTKLGARIPLPAN